MTKNTKFPQKIKLRLTDAQAQSLRAEAAKQGLNIATLVRDILEQSLTEGAAHEGRQALDKAIRRAIKPDIERLAKMIAKATVAGAASMYLNVQAIADLGKTDAVEMYRGARKKAVAYLREGEAADHGQ